MLSQHLPRDPSEAQQWIRNSSNDEVVLQRSVLFVVKP